MTIEERVKVITDSNRAEYFTNERKLKANMTTNVIPIEKTYTVHLPLERSANEPPIMTIVIAKADGGYKMGISVCNPKDQFNKKLGRKIAYGRMLNSKVMDKLEAEDRVNYMTHDIGYYRGDINMPTHFGIGTIFSTLEDRMKNK